MQKLHSFFEGSGITSWPNASMEAWRTEGAREEALSEARVGLEDRRRSGDKEQARGAQRQRTRFRAAVRLGRRLVSWNVLCCSAAISRNPGLRFDARRLLKGCDSRVADPLPHRTQREESASRSRV